MWINNLITLFCIWLSATLASFIDSLVDILAHILSIRYYTIKDFLDSQLHSIDTNSFLFLFQQSHCFDNYCVVVDFDIEKNTFSYCPNLGQDYSSSEDPFWIYVKFTIPFYRFL